MKIIVFIKFFSILYHIIMTFICFLLFSDSFYLMVVLFLFAWLNICLNLLFVVVMNFTLLLLIVTDILSQILCQIFIPCFIFHFLCFSCYLFFFFIEGQAFVNKNSTDILFQMIKEVLYQIK